MKKLIVSEKFKYFMSLEFKDKVFELREDEEILYEFENKNEEENILNLVKKLRPELFDYREVLKITKGK